jgi:hypothetical protein
MSTLPGAWDRGHLVLRGHLDPTEVRALARRVDTLVATIGSEHPAWMPSASSLRLGAVAPELVRDLAERVVTAPLLAGLHEVLGPHLGCLLDQAWARRQFPSHLAPIGHHPHAWHQDGALHHPFPAPGALLPLVTCWIPLVACGRDAPGIELVPVAEGRLLPLDALVDDAVPRPRVVPDLEPGDVLVLTAGTLHRTALAATDVVARTSVELRFVSTHPVPARLAGERVVDVGPVDLRTRATPGPRHR